HRSWSPGSYGTKTTGAGADIAEYHKRSSAGTPAFSHIRAVAAFADRMQLVGIHHLAYVPVTFTGWQPYAQPVRLFNADSLGNFRLNGGLISRSSIMMSCISSNYR